MTQGAEARWRTGDTPVQPVGQLPRPYLLFLGDTVEAGFAKTAFGLRDWAPDLCVGEFALPGATRRDGPAEAHAAAGARRGARALVIGVANAGGFIAESWIPALVEALEAGLDIVSGMHVRLADMPELRSGGRTYGRRLIDIRTPPREHPDRDGREAQRQAAADRRHRLRARQEIYGARDRARASRARGRTSISAPPARPAS